MKFKKFFTTLALTGVLAFGTALFVGQNVGTREAKQARAAATDVGSIVFTKVNSGATSTSMYVNAPDQDNSIPADWAALTPATEDQESGVFIDGVRLGESKIQKANTYDYYIPFSGVNVGSVLTVKGTFFNNDYQIHVEEFVRKWDGSVWDVVLEDYDVVSLADANFPSPLQINNNTDAMGLNTGYVTDPAGLPSHQGYFGLTNDTGSYAFQFKMNKSSAKGGWFNVLIGGTGTLWKSGHFMEYSFYDDDIATGYAKIYERTGGGENWTKVTLQESSGFQLYWNNPGEDNILEMGAIKIQGTGHYIFFKVNGVVRFGEVWLLADGAMTTRVCMVYNSNNATLTNSVDPVSAKMHINKTTGALYTDSDICPAVYNWDDYFMSVDGNGLKLNDDVIGNADEHWNYFKKLSATGFMLDLGAAGAGTIKAGDILYIGGMFKAARSVGGVSTLFKINIADSYFEYDGENWYEVNLDYLVDDFAIDLLKLTLPICQNSGDNHDALASLWATLASVDYFGGLVLDEKAEFVGATADSTIVVPTTASEIEAMDYDNLLAAAAYRYDYCTAKYSLTNFAGRTLSVSFGSSSLLKSTINETSLTVIVIVVSLVSLTAGCFFLLRKKKHQ